MPPLAARLGPARPPRQSGHVPAHQSVAELVAAGKNMETIELPFDLGEVDISTFKVDRVFSHGEDMVI